MTPHPSLHLKENTITEMRNTIELTGTLCCRTNEVVRIAGYMLQTTEPNNQTGLTLSNVSYKVWKCIGISIGGIYR